MKKRILILCGILVLMAALSLLPAGATEPTTPQDIDFSAGGVVSAVCPHCKGEAVDWLPLTQEVATAWGKTFDASNGTHYYLSQETVTFSTLSIAKGKTLCLHLNGNTATKAGTRIFNVNGTLNIMDHAANEGVISAIGDYSSTGCVLRLSASGATVNMYGGTVKMLPGATTTKTYAGNGGCVYMVDGSKFYLKGGTIAEGKALTGGNVFLCDGATFEMSGGRIENGKTQKGTQHSVISVANGHGGNVYLTSGARFSLTGGEIAGGYSIESGGNVMNCGTFIMEGGTLSGAKATLGGNLYVAGGTTADVSGGTITGGQATDRGGNIYMSSTNSKLNISGGIITGGKSTNDGGNLYLNNGQATITGGVITGGEGQDGGNIYANAGANSATNFVKIIDDGDAATPAPAVVNGVAKSGYGGNIYAPGRLTLGNCAVTGGTAAKQGSDLYVPATGYLTITGDFAGEMLAGFHSELRTTPLLDSCLNETHVICNAPFTGKIYVENDARLPYLYAKTGDTKAYVTVAALVQADGTNVWYSDNAALMANYNDTVKYIRVTDGELVLPDGDYLVDLCGQTIAVSGSGNVTFFDTANWDYKTYGTAQVAAGVTVKNNFETTVEDTVYYMIQEENVYSFHCMNVSLLGVSIRPSSSGVYYTGQWDCDEKLATVIDSFGVAVSLRAMPTERFETTSHCLYTVYGNAEFSSGTQKTSAIIEGILQQSKTAALNNRHGNMPIYAVAYLKLENGNVYLSQNKADLSLHGTMEKLDALITEDPEHFRRYKLTGRNFYEEWKDQGMGTWDFENLITPEKDDVIDVLMIGSSFCYYYVEELYALAEAAGVPMRVCNVYYSGCKLEWHYQWWVDGEANYQFFNTDGNGRVKTEPVSLEWCLNQGEWDVISLQQSTSSIFSAGAQAHFEETKTQRQELLGYLKAQFPDADIYWHQPWSHDSGYVMESGAVTDRAWQDSRCAALREYAILTCEEMGVGRVNTGEAWQIFRHTYVDGEPNYPDTLCKRLGVSSFNGQANSGDGYHDGDIGGGQYLNACVWFEILTGKDCRENTYRPSYTRSGVTYTLDEELVKALQESAHEAVADLRAWEAEQS